MDEVEKLAETLYEQETRKPGTVYPWPMLRARARQDAEVAAMLDRYRSRARALVKE
jgi:hypothetical protein